MMATKPIYTVRDFVAFTLYEADLTEKQIGDEILTPKRDVPCSDILWWIDYSPAGWKNTDEGYVSMFLWVSKPCTIEYAFAVDGSSFSKTGTHEFSDSLKGYGPPKYASHEQLRPLFRDGKLIITCNVKFDVPASFTIPRNFQLFDHVPTDIEFVIGSERVPAHKSFLALISPVLQATFKHNGAEYQSDIIDITEFDFETVKSAIDICYGREFKTLSVETAIGILRFCDMYLITAVINQLQDLPLLNPSVETFCTVFQYAYDCNKDKLLTKCYKYFKKHQDEIKATEKFAKHPMTLVFTVLKSAFDLETDYDVLRHAYNNGIDFVVNELKNLPLSNPAVETFCTLVHCAYDCNKDALLADCYSFFKEHQDEIKATEKFAKLPMTLVINVLKSAFELKTVFNVLHHAQQNGIDFVANHLENSLFNPITLGNFCAVVAYAWDRSREDLQQECAKFLSETQIEVLKLPAFFELSPTITHSVLKASQALKCGES